MSVRNTLTQYGSLAKGFHWLIAVLVIGMLCFGGVMVFLPSNATRHMLYNMHKLTGITILLLVILRLLWKWVNISPSYPNNMPKMQRFAAKFVQACLYVCIIGMPISGWLMSTLFGYIPHVFSLQLPFPWVQKTPGLARYFSEAHEIIAWSLFAFLVLHILGALYHRFVLKDGVFQRMTMGVDGD